MPVFSLDFDIAEVPGMEPVPPGIYNVVIREVKVGESKAGNPKITVRYEILDEEVPDPSGTFVKVLGKSVFEDVPLVLKAGWKLKELLLACGIDPKSLRDSSGVTMFDTDMLIGATLRIRVGVDNVIRNGEVSGNLRNAVLKHYPAE
jgi:hypothetical protein